MEKKKDDSQYAKLGVDSGKVNVREIFKPLIDNDYPEAFVNIITAPYTDGKIVMTQHQDGDGSKMVQRLLQYCETGDETQIGYALDDALAMNTSDVAAAGFVFGPWVITQVLNIGLAPEIKEIVMISLAKRWLKLKELYLGHGFDISFLGGETADLPDQVRSAVFDMTITAYADRDHIIKGDIQPGDKIWGFASDGRANWEERENSGLMANGLTLARACLMWKGYNRKYPTLKRPGRYYTGRFECDEMSELLSCVSVGDSLLSPTRQWPLVIKVIMNKLLAADALDLLHGISINTGGGASKIKNLGRGLIYEKYPPEPAAIFRLIRQQSQEKWQHMFKTFNCGVGIDIIGENAAVLDGVLREAARECGIDLYELGECRQNPASAKENIVRIKTKYGEFTY